VQVAYLFGGRYDAVSLGGNAVDIREDLAGFEAAGHEVAFRTFESAPLEVPAALRTAKGRVPASAWSAVRDVALLRKDRGWKQRLLSDPQLGDVELVFEYWFPDSFGGGAFARERRLPHVLENVDPLTDERRAGQGGFLNARARSNERRRRQEADALIVMARGMGDYLASEWGVDEDRIHWLPQGVNTAFFSPRSSEQRDAKRAELGLQDGELVVGFVGSMASYQRVDVLVDAIRRVRERRDDVRLVLLGGSPERAKALNAEHVAIVVPHVDYERVPDFISAFDVAVLPDSNWYGSPIKVLEYAATGVPVIAPDVGPVRDLVADFGDAVLIPPGDVDALATAIEQTLDDPVGARARAAPFGAMVREQFDRADRTRRLLGLCKNLVELGRHG
jgi:glycosyltransferase involved in cell wall biosynthesis